MNDLKLNVKKREASVYVWLLLDQTFTLRLEHESVARDDVMCLINDRTHSSETRVADVS